MELFFTKPQTKTTEDMYSEKSYSCEYVRLCIEALFVQQSLCHTQQEVD